jgi:hypothetical protein
MTSLEHNIAAVAVNLVRLDAWWAWTPLDRGPTTPPGCGMNLNKPAGS